MNLKLPLVVWLASLLCAHGVYVEDGKLYDDKGKQLTLYGINWFGFNNEQTMVDGLWAGKTSLTNDFGTVVYRMQLLGFNAVRLPFSMKDFALPGRTFMWCQQASTDDIRRSVTPPGINPWAKPLPRPKGPLLAKDGMCNIGMPNDTYQRFLWVVKYFAQAGWKVVIDNHVWLEDPTAYEDTPKWVSTWAKIAADVAKDPVMRGAVMFDLVNEPDNVKIFWKTYPKLGGRPRLGDLHLAAMDAIYRVHPGAVYVLEGTGQIAYAIPSGDGFVTSPAVLKQYNKTFCTTRYCLPGIEDPNPFFRKLMTRPYAQSIVWGPHVYAQSIIPFPLPEELMRAPLMYKRLSDSFGYLTKQGYAHGGKRLRWPVLIGEFAAPNLGSGDGPTMDALIKYMNNEGAGNDGRHEPVRLWFYWAWNNNSPDTGGIVGEDWVQVDWRRIEFLRRLGLKPWYA